MDAKGRTSLPSRFRDVLAAADDGKMVITTALEPCLVAYPYSGWRRFEEKLAGLPSFDPNVIQIKRFYVGSAMECPVDGHGRILLPSALRTYGGIAKNVVWCGMVSYIELWAEGRWSEAFSTAQEKTQSLGQALADLGL